MKIETLSLVNALKAILPALPKNTPLANMKQISFTKKWVIAYDDQISIRYPFKTDFQCTIFAEELYAVVSKIDEKFIDVFLKGNIFVIKSNTVDVEIKIFQNDAITEIIDSSINLEKLNWRELPTDFISALSLCEFSTSKDITQGFLACVYINKDEIYSSDNLRISFYKFKKATHLKNILIPSSAIKDLINYDIKFVSYEDKDSWIHFKGVNGEIFSCRILKDNYPNCSSLLELKGNKIEISKEVLSAIDLLMPFTKDLIDIDKKISFTVFDNFIFCKAEGEKGKIQKKIPIKYKGAKFSFVVNPIFLRQIFGKATSCIINTKECKMLFSNENFKHIMVLPEPTGE
ncbi:MAG: hypothetical protein ABFD07_03835 [Methanobacterium sp.]|jgi:hypothetical protein